MNLARNYTLASVLALTLTVPALAGIVVNQPTSGVSVASPFKLSASASTCSSSSVVTMGYSFDSSSNTTVIKGQSIDTSVSSSTGSHTLHVKAWGSNGASCVTSISIDVTGSSTTSDSAPATADVVSSIQALSNWHWTHDTGGPGSSSGSSSIVSSPALYGNTRKFSSTFSNSGDERFSISFSDNTNAENLSYDAWVYLNSSSSKIGNIEFDVNQVIADGKTDLIGFQCDGYSGEWAYNVNKGTASSPKPAWVSKSGTHCNPRSWTIDKWHHVQASFTRDSSGHVTYHSITFDGTVVPINVTAFVGASLGWAPIVNTQFQLDGVGSGTITAYVDNLTIKMW